MYDESERPNPDELLRQIGTEEAPDRTGKLKIFFGYSAGVGKTYAMLRAAHDLSLIHISAFGMDRRGAHGHAALTQS